MLGMEITNKLRGRVFAFIQSYVRILLVDLLAVAALAAAAIGAHDLNFMTSSTPPIIVLHAQRWVAKSSPLVWDFFLSLDGERS